jgi:hypothetical protein
VNLQTRLNAFERARRRLCSACGGPLVVMAPPRPKTWRSVMKDFSDLPDEERIAFHAHSKLMHKLSPYHQELAYRMYCDQQGIEYDSTKANYSGPNPPPAPWFPEEDVPVPKMENRSRW